jgi:hypothetical protein
MPNPANLGPATCRILLLEEHFTGRRTSDFGDVTLGEFSTIADSTDLTIRRTKVRSIRDLHLPQHRLLPKRAYDYILKWLLFARQKYSETTTLCEVITGEPWIIGAPLEDVRKRLEPHLIPHLGGKLSRLHVLRYAFGTWAPVAALLACHPDLLRHPEIRVWTGGSYFFRAKQLAAWRDLMGSPLASILTAPEHILGHTSVRELREDYCISWHLLMLIHALIRERDLDLH